VELSELDDDDNEFGEFDAVIEVERGFEVICSFAFRVVEFDELEERLAVLKQLVLKAK
jgi:hypothetical protein